jgi:Mn-containing catalase
MKFNREAAEADPLIAIAGGGGVNLYNSMGSAWTADYLKITGELDVDLRSNIAAEARAKIVYERLINFCDDPGTKDALQFLMTREITHMKAFAAALDSLEKPRFSVGKIAPTPGLVNQYFNDSTGVGDHGEMDSRGPWNEGEDWEMVEAPAFPGATNGHGNGKDILAESTRTDDGDDIKEVLIEQLRDLLHAEKQLLKALPKMARAAGSVQLQESFESHLLETQEHVVRLTAIFELLGESPKAKPCKGMMGLIEEGDEVIANGNKSDGLGSDLALIGAAHKIENYEIASYTTARNLSYVLRNSEVSRLLQMTLAEEQNADLLLDQLARPLMSVVSMPASII